MLGVLSWHSEMLFGAALSVSLAAGGMIGIWWSEIFYLEHKRKEGQKEKSAKSQASFIPALQAPTVSRGMLCGQHRHEERRKSMFKSLKCVFSTCEKIWAGKGTQKDRRSNLAYDNKEAPVQILQERRSEEERLRSYEPLKSRLGLLFYHFPASFIWWKSLSTVESVLLTSTRNNVAFGADHRILWLCLWHLQGIKQPGMFMGSHRPVMVETLWQQVPICLASHRVLCTQHDAQDLVDICLWFVEWANVLIACFHPKPQTCNYNWPKEILNYTFGRRFKIVGKTNLSISTPKLSSLSRATNPTTPSFMSETPLLSLFLLFSSLQEFCHFWLSIFFGIFAAFLTSSPTSLFQNTWLVWITAMTFTTVFLVSTLVPSNSFMMNDKPLGNEAL